MVEESVKEEEGGVKELSVRHRLHENAPVSSEESVSV